MPREINDPVAARADHTIKWTPDGSAFGLASGVPSECYLREGPLRRVDGVLAARGYSLWVDATSHRAVVSSTSEAESFLTNSGGSIP